MPVTLIEAKAALSPYVDNGVCSTDTRVTARINEAQRRLHSMRAWLGVLARYSVTVSGGQFALPAASGNISTIGGFGLESAIKVSSTTAASGFLTNSVQAFLADSGDILSLNFISSSSDFRTYSIEGNAPERVEVTGKLNYVAAVADTDLLVIDDLDALKLMILALYREENNQLDLAQALENKAVERLTVKTDRAIEAARRINYQTKRVNSAYGTLGYFRSKLALDLSDGLRLEDGKLVDVINRAVDFLLEKKKLLLSAGRYGVKDGLSLPTFTYTSTDSTTLAITNYQIVKLMVLSFMSPESEATSKHEAEAVKLLEEALIIELETKRHAQYSTALTTYNPGTLGNMKAKLAFELPNGLKMSATELVNVLNRAIEFLLDKKRLLLSASRYGVKDGLTLPSFTYTSTDSTTLAITNYQIVKLMVLSLMNPESEAAPKNEAEAVKLLEESLITELETKRHAQYSSALTTYAPGTLGNMKAKLAFELPNGLKTSETEFVSVINRAVDFLLEKKKLLLSAGRYGVKDGLSLPTFTYTSTDSTTLAITNYQIVKLMVLSFMSPESEATSKHEAEAVKLLEEALIIELETKRHAQYSTALTTYNPGTLGNMKAKLAFELPNGLKMSETELSNLLNTAEETLFSKGKWFGTIEHYKITVDSTQEVLLPNAVGSVLAVSIGNKPVNVFDRNFDYHENGTGYNTTESTGSDVFIDRGEVFSAGAWKRRYFVKNSYPDDCFNILVKKRWLRKNLDTSAMDIRNYPALKEMVLSILSQDPNVSDFHANRSEIILKKEISEARGGARNQLRVQAPAFALGDVSSLL